MSDDVQKGTLAPGMSGWWTYAPRGGAVLYVPVTIRKVGPTRVTVEARLTGGGTKRVSVSRKRVSCHAR
jgi:hypothetical protein